MRECTLCCLLSRVRALAPIEGATEAMKSEEQAGSTQPAAAVEEDDRELISSRELRLRALDLVRVPVLPVEARVRRDLRGAHLLQPHRLRRREPRGTRAVFAVSIHW